MPILTVDTDLLNSSQAASYFTRADRRVMIGLRATLEMLQLPVPGYGLRRLTGQSPAKMALALYNADHPTVRSTVLPPRKPNATPERIAAIAALKASGMGNAARATFGNDDPD